MMQPFSAPQKPLRVNCFKPMVGCVLGPILAVICLLSCACLCAASISFGGPEPLFEDFEPDPVQAQNYEDTISRDLQTGLNNGTFIVTINDEEFSSWLNLNYQDLFDTYEIADKSTWKDLDPVFQVKFDDQQIAFYAGQEWQVFTFGMLIIATASVPDGEFSPYLLEIDIQSLKVGALEASNISQSALESRLARLITDRFTEFTKTANVRQLEIQSVNIDNGDMILTGSIAQ